MIQILVKKQETDNGVDSILFKYAQHLTQMIILKPPQEIKEM